MDAITVIGAFAVLHFVLFFFDYLFKSCSHYPYIQFLQETGLQIDVFRIKWFTTALNRSLLKWGIWRPRLLQAWFSLGTIVSVLLLPFVVYLVAKMVYNSLQVSSSSLKGHATMELELLIPGVNLPLGEIGYYIITLLISSFVHELGHAVAAAREDVHVWGIGFILILILPIAFTHLQTDQLTALAPDQQLRIYCAGIWHNVVFAILAVVFLTLLPWILSPFFMSGSGVLVISVLPESSVYGPSGLHHGDIITSLNDCVVTDSNSWRKCFVNALQNPTPGFCTSSEFVRENDESVRELTALSGVVECCSDEATASGRLCFQLVDDSEEPVALPEHSCLPVRALAESGADQCAYGTSSNCEAGLHCLRPSLANFTKLVSIHRIEGKVVLVLGNPVEVYQSVEVSDFVPHWQILNPFLPYSLEQLLRYLTTLSAGMAITNIFPCFFFDGQLIVSTLCNMLLGSLIKDKNMRSAIALSVNFLGSLLLFSAVLRACWVRVFALQ